MTYETFREAVLLGLQNRELGDVSLSSTKQQKNNGQVRYGIVFSSPGTNTSPTIYLEEAYDYYQTTGNLNAVIDKFAELYRSLPAMQVDTQKFMDFPAAKDRIFMKLVNTEKNREFLEKVPHIPFQDLSIVYYCLIGETGGRIMDLSVNDQLLKEWGIDTLALHQHAMENYNRLFPVKFGSLNQYLLEKGLLETEDLKEAAETGLDSGLYYLSNEKLLNGAVLMTCKNLMDEITDFFGEDFYILPSSIHEVLLLPESKAPPKEELDLTVQEINQAQLKPEEILSDHVYYYSKSIGNSSSHFIKNLLSCSSGIIS